MVGRGTDRVRATNAFNHRLELAGVQGDEWMIMWHIRELHRSNPTDEAVADSLEGKAVRGINGLAERLHLPERWKLDGHIARLYTDSAHREQMLTLYRTVNEPYE